MKYRCFRIGSNTNLLVDQQQTYYNIPSRWRSSIQSTRSTGPLIHHRALSGRLLPATRCEHWRRLLVVGAARTGRCLLERCECHRLLLLLVVGTAAATAGRLLPAGASHREELPDAGNDLPIVDVLVGARLT